MWYSGAGGKLIHEKKRKQKISWHCPFKLKHRKIEIQNLQGEKRYSYRNKNFLLEMTDRKNENGEVLVEICFSQRKLNSELSK